MQSPGSMQCYVCPGVLISSIVITAHTHLRIARNLPRSVHASCLLTGARYVALATFTTASYYLPKAVDMSGTGPKHYAVAHGRYGSGAFCRFWSRHSSACVVCAHGRWRPTERPLCEADVSLLKLSTELHWYACSCLRQLGCGEAVCGPREICCADLCTRATVSITVATVGSMLPQGRLMKLSHRYTGAWRRAQVLFVPR